MNRRHFISALLGTAAGLALEEAIPFNRVWFFPQKIRLANNGYWTFGQHFKIRFPQQWLITNGQSYRPQGNQRAEFDRDSQIWIVKSVTDPIDWKIIGASLTPSSP